MRVVPLLVAVSAAAQTPVHRNEPVASAQMTCASCHAREAASHASTGMARALTPADRAAPLQTHPGLTFTQGDYRYRIDHGDNRIWYHVSDGKTEIRLPVQWAFGLGAAGQTYVLERDGKWYESRVSYYRDTDALDLTVGARPQPPRSIDEAIGRELSTKGALECFNCHATGSVMDGVLNTEQLTPGVRCERCHENSAAHMASFQQSNALKVMPRHLGSLAAEEMSEFCGQCHRTWSQIAINGPHNIANVRFQPYRLANSKCYDTSDARIRCTACHDPHAEPVRQAAYYDRRCAACHSVSGKSGAKLCKVAKSGCTSCHMPKVEIREAHNKFTDHWIRIVRPNSPYPD
jgi:hypothetical protein